jgi:hypothetical protein
MLTAFLSLLLAQVSLLGPFSTMPRSAMRSMRTNPGRLTAAAARVRA